MIENAVSKDLLRPCVDEFISVLKNNYENLIKNAMITTFSNMFMTEMKSQSLQYQLNNIIRSMKSE